MKQSLTKLGTLCIVFLFSACSKDPKFQTILGSDEDIREGSPVTLDNRQVGQVVEIGEEGGERVADFVVEDGDSVGRLREGLYRTEDAGNIALKTDLIQEGAKPLARGARVPVKGQVMVMIEKYGRGPTLAVAGAAVVVLVIVWLVFRSLVGTAMLIICGVLAGVGAQLASPYLTPHVKGWLDDLGPPPISVEAIPKDDGDAKPEVGEGKPTPPSANWVKIGEGALVKVASKKPNPVLVTWSAVFLVSFVALNMLLSRVSKAWRRAT